MRGTRRAGILGLALACLFIAGLHMAVSQEKPPRSREELQKTYRDGNYKDAYEGLRKLALDPKDDPLKVSQDLDTGIDALSHLGRVDEIDEFREVCVKVHGNNWRLLQTAA